MNKDIFLKIGVIEDKINELEIIGINVFNLKQDLEHIKTKINETDKNVIVDEYISIMNDLEMKLDNYFIFLNINCYTKYLNNVKVSGENISDIITEIELLLNELRNTSIEDNDSKQIIDNFYEAIFKIICDEIKISGKSELLDECLINNNDKVLLSLILEKYLNALDLSKYPEIAFSYYVARNNKNLDLLLNSNFLQFVIFKIEQEQSENEVKNNAIKLISSINASDNEEKTTYNHFVALTNDSKSLQEACKKSLVKLFNSLVLAALTLAIPISSFLCFFSPINKSFTQYSYNIDTITYSSLSNQVTKESTRDIISNGLNLTNTYLIKYNVLSDEIAKKEGQFHNYEQEEAKEKLRKVEIYDLSFLGYENIDKYKEYISSGRFLPLTKKSIIDMSELQKDYKDFEDYYEIVCKIIDKESKIVESSNLFVSLILSIFTSGLYTWYCYDSLFVKLNARFNFDYFKDRKYLNENKKELIEYTKILLAEIGKNDELRQQFNMEMAKHKDLFIKYGIELPKETVDSNIKKKLLGGK